MTTDEIVGWAVIVALLALIPAFIARKKRLGFWTFYVFGLMLWIGAMIAVLVMKDRRRRCPYCSEIIQPQAMVCPRCQRDLPSLVPAGARVET